MHWHQRIRLTENLAFISKNIVRADTMLCGGKNERNEAINKRDGKTTPRYEFIFEKKTLVVDHNNTP